MLDINFIRENQDLIKDAARRKRVDFDIGELIRIDDERRRLLKSVEEKRAEQNTATESIARASDKSEREQLIGTMQTLKGVLKKEEATLKQVIQKWQKLMLNVPNIPDMSVPEGDSDEQNKEIRSWGEKTDFSFEPKSHIELMQNLDMLDLERGAKVAGFRGYFLKNDAVLLSFAVWRFVFDALYGLGSFVPLVSPSLVRKEPFIGTGWLPQSEDDLYKTQDEMYLAGTSEVSAMGYYMNEEIEREKLPLQFLVFSPCFRREAGSYGKDTKGIMRVHEFFKFEQVVLCEASHEESVKQHEAITENAERLLQDLKIPHRVVINCGGDLGLGQVKKYDIEAWVPSENRYRETHSSSYFHDFQTRRLNIRYRDTDGKLQYAHSLNNTAIATPRILIAIVENYQQKDGSIVIPEVLRPYLHDKDRISV